MANTKLVSNEEQPIEEEIIYCFLRNPSFIGGSKEMAKYLSKHLKIDTNERKPSGKIWVQFYVLKDGAIENVQVIKGAEQNPILRKNLIEVFLNIPKWNPGEISESPKIRMTVPITIDLG